MSINKILVALCFLLLAVFIGGCATQHEQTNQETKNHFNNYTLKFEGFGTEEMQGLESNYVAYQGYQAHRPINLGHTYAEIWYSTDASAAQLHADLQSSLKALGLKALIQLNGNQILLKNIKLRKRRSTE